MEINLNDMSLDELKKLQTQINKAISSFEERRKQEVMAQLEAKAKEMGFTMAELLGKSAVKGKSRSAAAPKYAHPENPSVTWSGRGRKPGWVVEALAAGKSLDDLAI